MKREIKTQIEHLIFQAIEEINKQLPKDRKIIPLSETELFGSDSKLDSLGLVNLVVAVEQNIEDEFDVTITLADERAMSQQTSPFRTVGTLTDYIEMLLGEKLND